MENEHSYRSGGGAATQGGTNYQNRVAAWVCAHILGERTALPIGPNGVPTYARFETPEPVDDILIGTASGGRSFVQAKRTISLSGASDSEFASAIDQFVRQYLSRRQSAEVGAQHRNPLDPRTDRLVLVTTSLSSQPIRRDLAGVLDRIRGLTSAQSLPDAVTNSGERDALASSKTHIDRTWQARTGSGISDTDLRALSCLTYVSVLDVESSGIAEREALSMLETRVLERSGDSGAAWAVLVGVAADLSQRRSGIDQAGLRETLERAGIPLKGPPRYSNDIAKLRTHALETLRYLSHNSRIVVGETNVRITRPATGAVRNASETSSLVVVGQPGAGKSGVLHDFAESRLNEGRDVVFIAVDHIGAASLGELRNEIGLEHELIEVLLNWSGQQPGILVIDALDAARGDPASTTLLTLIRAIINSDSRWRVVASIRKYDLRYSLELRTLFYGNVTPAIASELQDPEFASLRHVNTPLFTDEELQEVRRQAPSLDALLATAPAVLQELLRVPFNLRLMFEIVASGVDISELRPIRTQNELLNRYWTYRVAGSGGDRRERLLARACKLMIEMRRLRTDRQSVVEPGASEALEQLLSRQVLVEWQPQSAAVPSRQQLAFSHNILFDFAASELFLPAEHSDVAHLFAADPDLVLVIRPSIVMHYEQLWEQDRGGFWELLFEMCGGTQIPQVGKVIGAAVLAGSARDLQDLRPLLESLSSEPQRALAETALQHLVGALTAGPMTSLAGATAGPYCEFLKDLTQAPTEFVAGQAQTLLRAILAQSSLLTCGQFSDAGEAARSLLTFAWSSGRRNSWLATNAFRSVCTTFSSDVRASAALLRKAIVPEHLAKYGYEEMHWLARDSNSIAAHDPDFISDVYAAVFGYQESSTERTDMSGSRILPLTSNRRQDYEHARWQLAENFPRFFERAPVAAARAAIRVINAYVLQEHSSVSSTPTLSRFDFNGVEVSLLSDYSVIWDRSGGSQHDDPLRILDAFLHGLKELVQKPDSAELVDQILSEIVRDELPAVIWARLLDLGASHPTEFGVRLRSLAWTGSILRSIDTQDDAANYLAAIFPLLAADEREKVERSILSFASTAADDRAQEIAERDQGRLLGRLNEEDLVTEEAKQLRGKLQATDALHSAPLRPRFTVSAVEMTETRYVEEILGVSAETESHQEFLELQRPVQEFQGRFSNNVPSEEDGERILPQLETLHAAIQNAGADIEPKLTTMGCGNLSAACKAIARTEQLSCDNPLGRFVRSVLMEMSHNPSPEHNPARDASFDEHPSWGAPLARIEAAQGLIVVSRHASCCDTEVLGAIERLAGDPDPAVRYQIATALTYLYQTAPDRMWKLFEERVAAENSNAVLNALAYSLNHLGGAHADRVVDLSWQIFEKARPASGIESPKATCLHNFVRIYLWLNHETARQKLYDLVHNIGGNRRELQVVLSNLRGPLTLGDPSQPPTDDSSARLRAVELFHRITTAACDDFTSLITRANTPGPTEIDSEAIQSAARLVDHAANELYFASGAFTHGQQQDLPSRAQQERFYRELTPTIDRLTAIGIPSAVHHLVEMLEALIPMDARKVFLQISALVESGRNGGYQYESLATEHLVRIIERYLAEYRPLLQEDADCRTALRRTLDAFIEAGWPAAQQLSYRLDEIFR